VEKTCSGEKGSSKRNLNPNKGKKKYEPIAHEIHFCEKTERPGEEKQPKLQIEEKEKARYLTEKEI